MWAGAAAVLVHGCPLTRRAWRRQAPSSLESFGSARATEFTCRAAAVRFTIAAQLRFPSKRWYHAASRRDPAVPMSRQVLFVQGGGERVHDDWDGKLVASLSAELGPDYDIRYPRMPNEADPSYATWTATLAAELANLDEGAIVVGHSLGGTFLINALAERPPERELGAIVLIAAPFVGEGGWQSDDWKPQRTLGERLPSGVPIYLYHGLADATVPASHAELYALVIPQAHLRRLPDRDHQLDNHLSEVAALIRSFAAEA
jgi:predicted alpha/beta hydrolase family esterase